MFKPSSLFVCQITYFATKSRLKLRTIGTLLGVLLGIPILYFVPSIEGQLILTIICGVSFFYLRQKKYALATLMATLMVLLIFNLKGAGYSIILPRLIDTLLGCFIAWLAVNFIWPDWNFRNIPNNIKKSSTSNHFLRSALIIRFWFIRSLNTLVRLVGDLVSLHFQITMCLINKLRTYRKKRRKSLKNAIHL